MKNNIQLSDTTSPVEGRANDTLQILDAALNSCFPNFCSDKEASSLTSGVENNRYNNKRKCEFNDELESVSDDSEDTFKFFSFFTSPLLWFYTIFCIYFGILIAKLQSHSTECCKHEYLELKKIYSEIRRKGNKIANREKRIKSKSVKKISQEYNNISIIQNEIDYKLDGRRIVDFNYLFKELKNNMCKHSLKKCELKDWVLSGESNFKGGLRTMFHFRCQRCKQECKIWSEGTEKNRMDPYDAAVLGDMVEGLGYTNVKGKFATMGLKYMSPVTFKAREQKLLLHLRNITEKSMQKAAEEEAALAKKAGDVTKDGIPYITVILDGSWLKRCFGSKYDSLAGLGVIIGVKTGKILHIGVKNKYCTKCNRSAKLSREPEKHICSQNFPRAWASTLMESTSLEEGFSSSIEKRGLIYSTFIGDGDSNFYARLLNLNPYKEHHITVSKIECTNHLLRNLCKKLRDIGKMTQKNGKKRSDSDFIKVRAKIQNKDKIYRDIIVDEIDMLRADDTRTLQEKTTYLTAFILNMPYHIYGNHKKCQNFNLSCDETDESFLQLVDKYEFLAKTEAAFENLSTHANSLLLQETNNAVEGFNSEICKYMGGKRINFACGTQYETRVLLCVLNFNSKKGVTEIFESLKKDVPETVVKDWKERMNKAEWVREYRIKNGHIRGVNYGGTKDENYGPNCEKPDLDESDPAAFKLKIDNHMAVLKEQWEDRVNIERQTVDQSGSGLWKKCRKNLITASNFGTICRKRPETPCDSFVKTILYNEKLRQTPAMKYGIEAEEDSIAELSKELNIKIEKNGLFIDEEDPRFGASPDGLIGSDGIVEIKNPYRARLMTIKQAMKTFKDLNVVDENTGGMLKTCHWFYQIQGQLHITRRNYCIFLMRTQVGKFILRIEKDDEFWEKEMYPQLSKFYDECLLLEIGINRHAQRRKCKDPPSIVDARQLAHLKQEEKKSKKKDKCEKNKSKSKNSTIKSIDVAKNNDTFTDCLPVNSKDENKVTENKVENVQHFEDDCYDEDCDSNAESILGDDFNYRDYISDDDDAVAAAVAAITASKADNDDSDDDILEILDLPRKTNWSEAEIARVKANLNLTEYDLFDNFRSFSRIETIVLGRTSWLSTDCLDAIILLAQQNDMEIISTYFNQYCNVEGDSKFIPPATKSISYAIIGGTLTIKHWRLARYDGKTVHIYDSLSNHYGGLKKGDLEYLKGRFPNVNSNDIKFKVIRTVQPDGNSCGLYAAAHLTYWALTGDPSNIKFSRDVLAMRRHYHSILLNRELENFPTE